MICIKLLSMVIHMKKSDNSVNYFYNEGNYIILFYCIIYKKLNFLKFNFFLNFFFNYNIIFNLIWSNEKYKNSDHFKINNFI